MVVGYHSEFISTSVLPKQISGDEARSASRSLRTDHAKFVAMSRISERGKLAQILIGSLMIVSTALLIFHTRWTTSLVPFKGPPSPSFKANDAHESNPAAGPASRNDSVEINLHPEEHIFRDPTTIRHIWNITSSRVAPDGVSKDVFLINGKSR
jgi:hypothetical protein